jgi:hypothetical protein
LDLKPEQELLHSTHTHQPIHKNGNVAHNGQGTSKKVAGKKDLLPTVGWSQRQSNNDKAMRCGGDRRSSTQEAFP